MKSQEDKITQLQEKLTKAKDKQEIQALRARMLMLKQNLIK
jgi:hypothetical protein